MLKSYLKIAFRHLTRDRGYVFINVSGLAIGLAACLLVYLYVQHELSFDTYHTERDRIYRLVEYGGFGEPRWNASVSGDPIREMRTSYPDVEDAVKLMRCGADRITLGENVFRDVKMLCADSHLFNIFSFDLLRGDSATVLDAPNTAVVTRSLAQRLFGDEDPVGESLPIRFRADDERLFEITGVMEDVPVNTHFTFDLLLSYESLKGTSRCLDCGAPMYALLEPGARPEEVAERALAHIRDVQGKDYVEDLRLEPLADVHFSDVRAERQGDLRYLYILAAIAAVMLLLACANYMNLATARYTQRSREVGVRKVLGAHRQQIMRQFVLESLLLTLLALPVALVLLHVALPLFNTLADAQVALAWHDARLLLPAAAALLVLVGLVGGSYPAFFLSASRPAVVLRGHRTAGASAAGLRKGLVVFQFVVSIVLVAFTLVVLWQLRYVQQKKLGFDAEQVVLVHVTDPALVNQPDVVKQEFLRVSSVLNATAGHRPPAGGFGHGYIHQPDSQDGASVEFTVPTIDENFLETLHVELLAGRNLSAAPTGGRGQETLVNEATLPAMGWSSPEEAIGQQIGYHRVVGVVEDFHFASLHREIGPLLMEGNRRGRASLIMLRIDGSDVAGALDDLEHTWKRLGAEQPFEASFLTDELDALYEREQKTAHAFGLFSGLAIFIACLGLFGLTAFTAERRTKEIGIRKVLGASAAGIVVLLSKKFVRLVGLAFVLAVPVAYLAASRWLESFAHRIEISWLIFLWAGSATLAIALLTVSYQAVRAALADPVESLRYE